MPVFKLSPSVRDYLLLVLRKCLFNRKSDSRKAAVHGYLLLLRNFTCAGSAEVALSSSQLSQTYQVGFVWVFFGGRTEFNKCSNISSKKRYIYISISHFSIIEKDMES